MGEGGGAARVDAGSRAGEIADARVEPGTSGSGSRAESVAHDRGVHSSSDVAAARTHASTRKVDGVDEQRAGLPTSLSAGVSASALVGTSNTEDAAAQSFRSAMPSDLSVDTTPSHSFVDVSSGSDMDSDDDQLAGDLPGVSRGGRPPPSEYGRLRSRMPAWFQAPQSYRSLSHLMQGMTTTNSMYFGSEASQESTGKLTPQSLGSRASAVSMTRSSCLLHRPRRAHLNGMLNAVKTTPAGVLHARRNTSTFRGISEEGEGSHVQVVDVIVFQHGLHVRPPSPAS